MKRGSVAVLAMMAYGVLLGGVTFALAPDRFRVSVPLYGGDTIQITHAGAVIITLGVWFAAFGAWGMSRGTSRNGLMAVLLGSAAPMITGSPLALVVSLPTLVGGIATGIMLSDDRDRARR